VRHLEDGHCGIGEAPLLSLACAGLLTLWGDTALGNWHTITMRGLGIWCFVFGVRCYVLRVPCYVLRDVLRVTRDVSRVTCHVSRVTCHVLQCYVFRVTCLLGVRS